MESYSRKLTRFAAPSAPVLRKSNGTRHFFQNLPTHHNLHALDLGGINEANVEFLSDLGCKIYSVDLLASYERARQAGQTRESNSVDPQRFLDEYLAYAPEQFDAILVWDALEHLDDQVLGAVVRRLNDILKPGGGLLAFFHSEIRGETIEVCNYQIQDGETLCLRPREWRRLPHTFNNRNLERLFADFHSVKFFLTRDNLREVIVIR